MIIRVKPLAGAVTAPLPEERVRPARPFNTIGCDFAEPIYLKNDKKSYIGMFNCALKLAVHLELVPDMIAIEFRIVLHRFVYLIIDLKMVCIRSPMRMAIY